MTCATTSRARHCGHSGRRASATGSAAVPDPPRHIPDDVEPGCGPARRALLGGCSASRVWVPGVGQVSTGWGLLDAEQAQVAVVDGVARLVDGHPSGLNLVF